MMEQIEMNSREASKFRALNRMVGGVAQRDLNLLNTIDKTIDSLCELKAEMDILADTIQREIQRLKDTSGVIDEDGSIILMLEETRDVLGQSHAALIKQCATVRKAPELHPDDGVVEAFCEVLDSTAALHNAVNDLCWAIGEHDADLDEKLPGSYSNADDLFAAMGV
jgi:hypothetical protein